MMYPTREKPYKTKNSKIKKNKLGRFAHSFLPHYYYQKSQYTRSSCEVEDFVDIRLCERCACDASMARVWVYPREGYRFDAPP